MPRLKLPPLPFPLPPALAALPRPAILLIALLIAINALLWSAAAVILHFYPKLISPAVLSYTLGLRHALDADHISAIDLMTRRLIASGQRPVAVGTFFSLGHSTIVIVTCVVVAATSGALRERFDDFQRVGGIIGTGVSAGFLLLLCAGNGWVLWRLVRRLREVLGEQRVARGLAARGDEEGGEGGGVDGTGAQVKLEGAGFLSRVFRKLFKVVDRPWKMFPLGMVFGLGFDTSSEIAILGIASVHAVEGTSMWLIMVFPILFTAGMCLIDTMDGALMMALYTNKAFSRDVVAILYYSIVLTGITVFVSAFIGIIQLLSLVQNVAEPEGGFWDGVSAIGDHFDIIGGSICGLFVVVGLVSVLVYRPWRKRMDRRVVAEPEGQLPSESEPPSESGLPVVPTSAP